MPVGLALPAPDPGFELVLSSHGMSQGISQTRNGQIIPRAYLRLDKIRIGGQWRNIDSPIAGGIGAVFVRHSLNFGRTELDVTVAYRIRTGLKRPAQKTAWEFTGHLKHSFGRFGLRALSDYSLNDFTSDHSTYVELGPTFDLDRATVISANVGRRERERGLDYTSFNVGISRVVARKVTFDARYYGTNRSQPQQVFADRFVMSARISI